jgi:hypothetical protein
MNQDTSLETILTRYDEILKNEALDQLLPFLQSVEKRHYEGLKKHIRKAKRYWMVDLILHEAANKYDIRGSEKQQKIVILSALALFNKDESKSWDEFLNLIKMLEQNPIDLAIIEWSKPQWLGDYLLQKSNINEWHVLPYRTLVMLEEKQLVNYNPQLFSKSAIRYNGFNSA